jgi:hypothetical protein
MLMENAMENLAPVKKKTGPAITTGRGELIGFRIHAPMLAALDEYIGDSGRTRQSVMREFIANALRLDPKP